VRTVSNLERGINKSPYPSTVRALADALDLPADTRAELVQAARRADIHEDPDSRPTGGYLGARPAVPLVAREAERMAIVDALDDVSRGRGRFAKRNGGPMCQDTGGVGRRSLDW
jgi:hypothetical protein